MGKKSKLDMTDPLNGTSDDEKAKREKRLNEYPPVSFIEMFKYSSRIDLVFQIIGVLATCGSAACQPLNMLVFGNLSGAMVDYASDKDDNKEAADAKLKDDIDTFVAQNLCLGFGMFAFSFIASILFNYSGINQGFRIRTLYLEAVFNQDISYYDLHQSGDFASRMGDDLTKLEDGLSEKVSLFLHNVFSFIGCILMALIKGWELALISLVSLPIITIALSILAMITAKFARSEADAYGAAGAIADASLSSVRTVLAFGGQEKETNAYNKELDFAKVNNIKRHLFGAISMGILWLCIYGTYALAFWYGIKLVIRDNGDNDPLYDASTMVSVFFSVMTGSVNFGMSAPFVEVFGIARGAAGKIFGVIDSEPVINKSRYNGARPDKLKGVIEFKNIKFHYPSRPDVPILQGLSLTVNPGETVALVGSSGCGKSTTIQLMQRFYDPLEGGVYLDGNNIKDLDLIWLRNNMGVVGQEPVLFGTTVAENIRYGMRSATQEQIEKAAKKANAHRFILTLPNGYDTIVGERGAQMSGGQKQRIAIARALVREPSILLLDEATSALDTNSEAKVQAALDSVSKECTTIIIAHRLSTIRGADRIVVVNKGVVSEQGTHEELMKKHGEYYDLVTTQVAMVDEEEMKEKRLSLYDEDEDVALEKNRLNVGVKTEIVDEDEEVPFLTVVALNKPEWWLVLIGIIGSSMMGAAMPIFSVLFGNILGTMQYVGDDDDYVKDETRKYSLYFMGMGIVTGTASFAQMLCFGIAAERLIIRLRTQMFASMLSQEIGWFDKKENGVGALCTKLSSDAALIQGATGQRIGTIFQSISTLCLSIGFSIGYEYSVGFVALAFTPIILGSVFLQQRSLRSQNDEYKNALEGSTKLAVEAVGNIRTVVSLVSEEYFKDFYVEKLKIYIASAKRNTYIRGAVLALSRSIMFFAYTACMSYGGKLIREDGVDYENVLKVSQSLIIGTVSIANALAFAPNFQRGLQAAARIFNLLQREPEIRDAPDATDNKWKDGTIQYSKILFSYPTRPDTPILQGLDLSIFDGKTVALVGPSGCGKSTIIQLIERYYDPRSGVVSVDGQDLKQMKLRSLRSNLGIVSQEPNLFDRSIGQNIAYGDNTRVITQDEIIAAAKKANIHNFIAGLPLGYETPLGDKGAQLSGGQKQRVAIARALVRNPRVLLLDEATSALDTESEKVVQAALDEAKAGRTCITIAHRLTTIQDADVICVINQGLVFEMGTHNELLALKGIYHKLYTLQNGNK